MTFCIKEFNSHEKGASLLALSIKTRWQFDSSDDLLQNLFGGGRGEGVGRDGRVRRWCLLTFGAQAIGKGRFRILGGQGFEYWGGGGQAGEGRRGEGWRIPSRYMTS